MSPSSPIRARACTTASARTLAYRDKADCWDVTSFQGYSSRYLDVAMVLADSALASIGLKRLSSHQAPSVYQVALSVPCDAPGLGAAGTRRITPSRGLAGVLMSDTFQAAWFS